MSDNIRDSNDNLNVDPRLDALLSRALSRGSVPRQQRQRHLERLGLAPRLGGSAGAWRAPVVAGRPPSSTPQPASLPARRRRRQWLEVSAAVLAVVLVGALLVALFRDWSGGEDDQQLAASPEATSPPATATPRETREQLYVVGHAMTQAQDAVIPEGRASAIDPETGEEFWSVEAGPRIDGVLSPDGQRLFVASSELDGDFVYALDTQTGRELWRQPIENRWWHKPGFGGYSTMSVSPDGGTVSVYTCEGCTGEFRSTDGRNWLAQFDAVTGNRQPDLEITVCRGQTFLGPEVTGVRPMYVVCDRTRRMEMVDLATGQPLELTYDTFLDGGFPETIGANAVAISPDGRWLYLASGNRLTIIDMTRNVATRVQLDESINVEQRLPLLALSPDGRRLFIGSQDASALVNRVDVYDAKSLQPFGQVTLGSSLTNAAFASSPDGDSVYGIFAHHPMTDDIVVESTIQRLTLDVEPATIATRTNEEVLFLYAGTVEVDPDAAPRPTPTPEPTSKQRLFAVSQILEAGTNTMRGSVTAYDAEAGGMDYQIATGPNPDAVLSPDGTRLYIVADDPDSSGEVLSAHEALSGDELWSVGIENVVQWMLGEGPTALAVSYDGSRLFVYSASAPGDYTIQVFDTADGRLGRVIDGVAGCTAQLFPSADGRSLYVVCLAERFAPQVIDLEAWTSAGVMQGFGGIISGAAASPDGRWLYIPQDIDTEMSLSVIDMNGRSIADMRSIIHLASDPLHSLNITAVSPDGSRLFIGVGNEPEGGAPVANEVWVWDTTDLSGDTTRLQSQDAITGWSLAPGPDNRSVYAIHNESGAAPGYAEPSGATILRLSLDGGPEDIASRPDWQVLRLFSGRVTDTPEPPSTDAPDTPLPDLTIPDNLPLGLTLSSRLTTGPEHERLIFTGDETRVVQIDVRRWADGEVLDQPDDSMPIHIGSLTVHVTADPPGWWPRLALWHDPRFVYDLSFIEGAPGGWTQDALNALVTAFSSPVSASVCPAETWTGPEVRDFGGLPDWYWIDGDGLAIGDADGRLVEGENEIAWIAGPSQQLIDPAVSVSLRGTRLGTGYQQSAPLEVRDLGIEQTEPMGDAGVRRYLRSTVIFPSSGCWQIEAEMGDTYMLAIVHVEPDSTFRNSDATWDALRWRPLHELGINQSPPCLRMAPQQVIDGLGSLAGDMQANGGPVYLSGLDEDGAIRIAADPMEDGSYAAEVSFVTSGDYTGPLLVRPAPGSGVLGFSSIDSDLNPRTEWRLQDPADIHPTGGVRQWWPVHLRLDGPGCYALQIDGLDFTSIIVFEVLAEDGS